MMSTRDFECKQLAFVFIIVVKKSVLRMIISLLQMQKGK